MPDLKPPMNIIPLSVHINRKKDWWDAHICARCLKKMTGRWRLCACPSDKTDRKKD